MVESNNQIYLPNGILLLTNYILSQAIEETFGADA